MEDLINLVNSKYKVLIESNDMKSNFKMLTIEDSKKNLGLNVMFNYRDEIHSVFISDFDVWMLNIDEGIKSEELKIVIQNVLDGNYKLMFVEKGLFKKKKYIQIDLGICKSELSEYIELKKLYGDNPVPIPFTKI